MAQRVDRNDIIDALYTLTQILYDKILPDPTSKSQINIELTNLMRNYMEDLPTTITKDSGIKQQESQPALQQASITKRQDISLELMNILNFIEIDNPRFLLTFSQNNENDFKLYTKSLHYVILQAFYSIFLSKELRSKKEIINMFSEGGKEQNMFQSILKLDFVQVFEQSDKTALFELNKTIIGLGTFLVSNKISASGNYKDKFKLILDVINNRYLFLTDYGNLDHFSFIRLCIEAVIISLNVYNLSVFIRRHAEDNFKVKSIIINKTKKLATNYPFMILQDNNVIKIILCIYDNKIYDYNNTVKEPQRSGKRSDDFFSQEMDTTREINFNNMVKQNMIALETVDNSRSGNIIANKHVNSPPRHVIEAKVNASEKIFRVEQDLSIDITNQPKKMNLNVKMSPLNINVSKKINDNKKASEELKTMLTGQNNDTRNTPTIHSNPLSQDKKYNIFDFNLANNNQTVSVDHKNEKIIETNSVPKLPIQFTNEIVATDMNFFDSLNRSPGINGAIDSLSVSKNDRKPDVADIHNIESCKKPVPRVIIPDKPSNEEYNKNHISTPNSKSFTSPKPNDNRCFFQKNSNFNQRLNDFVLMSDSNTHALNFCVKFTHNITQNQNNMSLPQITKTYTRNGIQSPDMSYYNRPVQRVHTYDVSERHINTERQDQYHIESRNKDNNVTSNRMINVPDEYNGQRRYVTTPNGPNRIVLEHGRPPSVRRYVTRGHTVEKQN